jgi:hypothetical protein
VLEQVFQGSVVRYSVEGEDGTRLTAIVPLDERLGEGSGAGVWATWPAGWAYVLPVSAGAATQPIRGSEDEV